MTARLQRAVGAPETGEWDDGSRHAHDQTIVQIRTALGLPGRVTWDRTTEATLLAARDLRARVWAACAAGQRPGRSG
jgi:hypothetical protein